MERIEAGRAHCALCGEVIRLDEGALVTPDFLADEADPFWRFSDAPVHRACFFVWDRRKAFVAHYNQLARRWMSPDGSHPHMTSEGEVVRRPADGANRPHPADRRDPRLSRGSEPLEQ
jgi:hypothetical protein